MSTLMDDGVKSTATLHTYPRHDESAADIQISASRLFDVLDNHTRLSSHMSKPSWQMGGGKMEVIMDEREGKAVGAPITLRGRVLGLELSVDETVTVHEPPFRKVWETVGMPHLLVIGAYRMAFEIEPRGMASHLRVEIDYELPARGLGWLFGRLFGRMYARWCTRQMVADAARIEALPHS